MHRANRGMIAWNTVHGHIIALVWAITRSATEWTRGATDAVLSIQNVLSIQKVFSKQVPLTIFRFSIMRRRARIMQSYNIIKRGESLLSLSDWIRKYAVPMQKKERDWIVVLFMVLCDRLICVTFVNVLARLNCLCSWYNVECDNVVAMFVKWKRVSISRSFYIWWKCLSN